MTATTLTRRRRYVNTATTAVKEANYPKIIMKSFWFFGAGFWLYLAWIYITAISGLLAFFGAGVCLSFAAMCILLLVNDEFAF